MAPSASKTAAKTKPADLTVPPSPLDAGNRSLKHYQSGLSPFRFRLRNRILPVVRKETQILANIQAKVRTPTLDFYFAWSANLASHTFYVLMLPLANWFGSEKLARDLVFVLGFGIYITGNLKDFLCLPRPRSPPLHRITLSSYTAQEYGFPSSHSANATAVSLIMAVKISELSCSTVAKIMLYAAIAVYYVSLIFGRVYCGMHGFFDVLTGTAVGTVLFLFRHWYGQWWDSVVVLDTAGRWGWFLPPVLVAAYLILVHIHFEPVDNCPCFDDSVAFIGVLIGLDLSHWLAYKTGYFATAGTVGSPLIVPFDFEHLGLVKTILRVAVGMTLVVSWKAVSKPVVFTVLPPIYKAIGVNLPRKNFEATAFSAQTNRQIRKASISNLDAEEAKFIGQAKDAVGVQDDIDYYEMIGSGGSEAPPDRSAGVFKSRYDVEIIGRLIIYAGVATASVWGFAVVNSTLGL
ncbi:PAP2-domain-containing protein, partial [Yamadazyma tenuis ATCC 10573]